MLPLPNLDDRSYEQLVREARDMIPSIFPDWTDENAHDPGITLLELLAWHLEMQQYRLDRLTVRNECKYLKLLGEAPRDRQPSRSSVTFGGVKRPIRVRMGTRLRADDLYFETEEAVTLLPEARIRVSVSTASGVTEVTGVVEEAMASFYPFGPEGEVGSRLQFRFPEPLPSGESLSLWIDLAVDRDDAVPFRRVPYPYPAFVPSGTVLWQYWGQAEDGTGEWLPLPLERDETHSFHQSGAVRFSIPEGVDRCTRIAAFMSGGRYDTVPRIQRLMWNEVAAVQGETHAVSETFDASGEPNATVEPQHELFLRGRLLVQVRSQVVDGGWTDWEEVEEWPNRVAPVYKLERSVGAVFVRFGDGVRGRIPETGIGNIRLVALSDELDVRNVLGIGTGISGQAAQLPLSPVLPGSVKVQVGWLLESSDDLVWFDWERVLDFDNSGPNSFHYILDAEENMLRFSDGENGAVPPAAPFHNIRLIGCRVGGGEAGNIKEGRIRTLETESEDETLSQLQIANIRPAEGGAEPETMTSAIRRMQLSILEPDCGVTSEDLERLVLRIPGLRIARVKAVPGFKPGQRNYPDERAFGHISIVVVPYVADALPLPSAGMIETVRRHLEPYRMLTTVYHVMPPEYVKVSVRATVVVNPRYMGRESLVAEALERLFQPYGNESRAEGWKFGSPIYKGDVYDVIQRVSGVVYVQDVWVMADGKDVRREEGGDVRIPPNALVVSGTHEIEFIPSER